MCSPLESSNVGRVPLSTSEVEYCREQSKLKPTAAWLSSYSIRQHSSGGAKIEVFEDINLKKIALHGHKSPQRRMDVRASESLKAKPKCNECFVVCHPVMKSYFLGGLLFDCKFPDCIAERERL